MTLVQNSDGSVPVLYGGFWIGDFDFDFDDPKISPRLVTQNGKALWISTGCESGSVRVVVELHTGEPQGDLGFEEVEEAELKTESGDVRVHPVVPVFGADEIRLTLTPGGYSTRVAAIGRLHADAISHGTERYRIQVWPAGRFGD